MSVTRLRHQKETPKASQRPVVSASRRSGFSSSLLVRMGIRALFLSTSLFGFMMWWDHPDYIKIIDGKYAGKYEYLTYIGAAITIGTIVVSSIADLICYFSKRKSSVSSKASEIRNWFLAIAFPVETIIAILYWSLRAYDRTLLSTTYLLKKGGMVPIQSDLSLHLFPFIYVWIELLVFSSFFRHPFLRRAAHQMVLIAFNGAYIAWSHFLFMKNKKWVYPLLGKLTMWQHLVLVATTSSLTLVSYLVGTTIVSMPTPIIKSS